MSSAETTPPTTTSNDDAATTVSGITTATGRGTTAGRGSQGRGGGGRGTGRGGRGGRNNNRRNRNRSTSSNTSTATVKADKFVGKTPALEGHCFHVPAEKPKRTEFITTLEAIRLYASDKYKSQYRRLKITLFEEFKEPTVKDPVKPTDPTSATYDLDVKIYLADYTENKKEKKDLENTLESLFDVIYGQCSPLMRVKLNAIQTFKDMRHNSEVWELLKQIKGITHQFQANICPYEAIDEAKRQYYSFVHNNDHMDTNTYLKNMKNIVDSIEFYGATLGEDKVLIEYEKALDLAAGKPPKSDDEYKALTKNKMIAVGILRRADKRYFGHVLRDLRNEFQLGRDTYPENPTRALDLLQNYHPIEAVPSSTSSRSTDRTQSRNDTPNEGDASTVTEDVQFTQVSTPTVCPVIIPGTNGKSYPQITCRKCDRLGHYANFCPTKKKSAAETKSPASSSVPVSILKPATILPDASPKKPPTPPKSSAPPQLAQLEDVASMDNIALEADAVPPDPPNYESDDTLEPDFVCTQTVDVTDPALKDCILVDTGSSVNTFGTSSYVSNIRRALRPLTTNSTGGLQQYTQTATFFGFMDVWFDADCLVNILSFFDLQKHFRITIDTAVDPGFYVHIRDGTTLKFLPYKGNIYLLDPVDYSKLNTALTSYSCANVVAENKVNFTRREIEGAERARALYKRMQKPAYSVFLKRLANNLIRDSKVTLEDAQRAYAIYGPDLDYSKGHDTRKQPPHLPYRKDIPIPRFILQYHSEIVVFTDFFFANAESYLHSISEGYKFRTGQATPNRTKATMLKCVTTILKQYRSRGIKVTELRADGEFACIQDDVPCRIATAAPGTHVPEVERSIRYIKEGARTSQSSLPFKRRPRLLNRGNIYSQIINANDFPTGDGLSDTLSPATLITGRPSPSYDEIMKVGHGDYVHAYTETKNDMSPRAVGAIALYPAKNGQGGWYFLSLRSGKRILCNQWKNAVICDKVIDRVHALADAEVEKARYEDDESMMFEWRPGQGSIEFSTDDNVVEILDDAPPIVPDPPQFHDDDMDVTAGTNLIGDFDAEEISVEDVLPGDEEDGIEELTGSNELPSLQRRVHFKERDSTAELNDDAIEMFPEKPIGPRGSLASSDEHNILPEEHIVKPEPVRDDTPDTSTPEVEEDPPPTPPPATSEPADNENRNEEAVNRFNLRRKTTKPVSYKETRNYVKQSVGKQFVQLARTLNPDIEKNNSSIKSAKKRAKANKKQHKMVIKDTMKSLTALIFTQMIAKKGIEQFGDVAIQAILKEYKQLHDLNVFKPRHKEELTKDQLDKCLRLITLIKEKRCGKIKGRACADGRSQRAYIPKEEAAAPTVSLDSLMLTLMTDAYEGNDVATCDIAGAFLKGDMDDFVLVKLINEEVDIMCDVNPIFKDYVVQEGKNRVLYMQLNKALYGCLKSAIIWYDTYITTLKDMGFKINPYDPCVANKMIEGTMCVIAWYVDDNKISHKNPKVVDDIIAAIEKRHGKMTVCRGKKHVFVGMDIEFLEDQTVKIMMQDYIQEAIDDFGEDVSSGAKTPATNGLFEVNSDSEDLSKDKADTFHSIVAKLLFVCIRARLDIGLAIAFLTTRVSKPTVQDWLKLKRTLRYLHATIDMPRIFGAKSLNMFKSWIDASYATHMDRRGHTGGCISFGKGLAHMKTKKQSLNGKSSTETEVIGASDYLPWVIWIARFMEYQGYTIDSKIFYQDNESAMKLEKNGRKSCGDKSRHIDIRYFFIKDVLRRENIDLQHCPTERMIADFYTKPLQGSLFIKMRNFIMGLDDAFCEERVENCEDLNKSQNTSSNDNNVESIRRQPTYAEIARRAVK